jgi:uncharacterized protein YoxC
MTARRARRSLGILLVALAVALGACGSSQTDSYKKDAKAIVDPLRSTINSTDSRISAQKTEQAKLAELDKTRSAVDDAATKLEKLTPPDDAKAEHDEFVTQLHTFGDDIKGVETAATAKDAAATRQALAKLKTDTAELKKANDALKAKVNG